MAARLRSDTAIAKSCDKPAERQSEAAVQGWNLLTALHALLSLLSWVQSHI